MLSEKHWQVTTPLNNHIPVPTSAITNRITIFVHLIYSSGSSPVFLAGRVSRRTNNIALEQRFIFERFLWAWQAHWWEFYVPRRDFMCSSDWNLDNSRSVQDISTMWTPYYISKELSNDTNHMAVWSIWRWLFNLCPLGAPLHMCFFHWSNAPWAHGRSQCESVRDKLGPSFGNNGAWMIEFKPFDGRGWWTQQCRFAGDS